MEEALQKLEEENPAGLDPNLKETIRTYFDREMKDLVPPNGPVMKINAASIHSYAFVEHTWKFNLVGVSIRKKRHVAECAEVTVLARNHKNFHGKAKRHKRKMEDPDL